MASNIIGPVTDSDKAMSRRHHQNSIKLAKLSLKYHTGHSNEHKKGAKGAAKMLKKHSKALVKLAKGE